MALSRVIYLGHHATLAVSQVRCLCWSRGSPSLSVSLNFPSLDLKSILTAVLQVSSHFWNLKQISRPGTSPLQHSSRAAPPVSWAPPGWSEPSVKTARTTCNPTGRFRCRGALVPAALAGIGVGSRRNRAAGVLRAGCEWSPVPAPGWE